MQGVLATYGAGSRPGPFASNQAPDYQSHIPLSRFLATHGANYLLPKTSLDPPLSPSSKRDICQHRPMRNLTPQWQLCPSPFAPVGPSFPPTDPPTLHCQAQALAIPITTAIACYLVPHSGDPPNRPRCHQKVHCGFISSPTS